MEKVQFQLESTLPELKDLYDKGLFSRSEIDAITKRRTAFETSLIRRVARKEDFFRYAEYEINLERLRKVRWKKLRYHINRPPPSASTFSIPRRTLYILKRATAKFPGDLAVWLAYIEYAAREGMTKIVAKGLNSAMQHHPLSPTLYLLLSYHHLHPGEPLPRSSIPSTSTLDLPSDNRPDRPSAFALEGTGPARTTLLLGLRVLPQSHVLWREYVKLELGWVEALRRRWAVLGIAPKEGDGDFDGDAAALAGGDGAFGPEGEDARRAILSGQLVLHALESGLAKVTPASQEKTDDGVLTGIDFRDSLVAMLRTYPSPLRTKALNAVYADLEKVAATGDEAGAHARLALITRSLYDRPYETGVADEGGLVLSGIELVDALGSVGREIRSTAKTAGPAFIGTAGSWLADRADETKANPDLQRFLFSTLKALTKPSLSPPATLLARHLALTNEVDPAAYLATTRAAVAQHPTDPTLQLARVRAETDSDVNPATVRKVCTEAAQQVTVSSLSAGDQEKVLALWRTWAAYEDTHGGDWKRLLRESLRIGAGIPGLHASLLAAYYASQLRAGVAPKAAIDAVVKTYSPTAAFYASAFGELEQASGAKPHLATLYGRWRAACRTPVERVDAALQWAAWLIERGEGRDAAAAVDVVKREVREDEDEIARLEAGWRALIDAAEIVPAGDVEMESDSEDEQSEDDEDEDEEDDEEEGSEEEGGDEDEGSDEGGDEESENSGDLEIAM